METCKDCLHFGICKRGFPWADGKGGGWCENFKDKHRFTELPCKVGDTVYYIGGIHGTLVKSAIVEEITINCHGISGLLVTSENCYFEKSFDTFFLTKKEAEAAILETTEGK